MILKNKENTIHSTRAHHGDEIPECDMSSSYLFTYLPLNYDTPVVP